MLILGISAFYHDSAACLLEDGNIIAAAQEERFTRIKHDHNFPSKAVEYCLKQRNIEIKDIDYVAFYDKPFLKFERLLESYLAYAPKGILSFIKAMPLWVKEKLWMKNYVQEHLNFTGKIIFPEHHLSHAASAFYASPFDRAAFLTHDGVGEWATSSFGTGVGNELKILAEQHFPHSLGMLYSAFTYYTGFKVNSGEYKVMGLAPYGEPKYRDIILNEIIDLKEDGSFRMNMDYFNYGAGLTMTSPKFHDLFGGEPRQPESALTQKEMDLARSVQEVTDEIILRAARHVREVTGMNKLCMAGGVALNCVSNGKLLKSGIFDDIWIQPAAGDAGGALGAALFTWYSYLGQNRTSDEMNDQQKGSYLGPEFSDTEIEEFLKSRGAVYKKYSREELILNTARLIGEENVIGWFQGRMEFGPRALGARTIIGDARSEKMQQKMNLKIKFRESFRPFAPSVLCDRVSDYFEIECRSPYMLIVADVVNDRRREMTDEEKQLFGIDKLNVPRSDIPAVTHVDYSARIQTVHPETNPLYYDVIKKFDELYGCGVIVNTSFNVRGEPIVCTPEDAYLCFMRTSMDFLVMGSFILDKKDQPELKNDSDWRKQFRLD